MIRKLALAMLIATAGLVTVAVGQVGRVPSATAYPALQGPQSGTLVLGGSWANSGNGIAKVRVTVTWTPAAGGPALSTSYDLDAPPAIMGTSQWVLTTPVPTQQNPAPFKVNDTITMTSITVYTGPPAVPGSTLVGHSVPGQNLKVQ